MNIILRKFCLGWVLCALIVPACSLFESNIKEIDCISQASNVLEAADQNTLVVFDLDDTLISPVDKIVYLMYKSVPDVFDAISTEFVKTLKHDINIFFASQKGQVNQVNLASSMFSKARFTPVEKGASKIVQCLQKRGIKVIALTAAKAGRYGIITNNGELRLSNLKSIDLDFSSSFNIQNIVFDKLEKHELGGYPEYYRGILMAANSPKGKVLAAFFKNINWKPDKVIFFDDGYNNCKSVADEMNKLGILVQCFWYRAAIKHKIKLNHNALKYQFDHWVKSSEFLTEEEILTQIKQVSNNNIVDSF